MSREETMNYEMQIGTKKYNDQFAQFWHYKNHPQMMPFVGNRWGEKKKLLLIGESHYLAPGFDVDIIHEWYDITLDELEDDDFYEAYWMTNTARMVDDMKEHSTKYPAWHNIEKAICETGFKLEGESIFSYLSYMNFFQRPAEHTARGILATDEDKNVANETLDFVTKIIKPDYIFFVSSLSWKNFDKKLFPEEKAGHGTHPARPHWNMKASNFTICGTKTSVTGKESFMDFITYYKIFE
jgi:hypothetical protein